MSLRGFIIVAGHLAPAGEDVGEVLFGVDSQAAAVFYDGVVDGALFSGHLVADEEPIFSSQLGGTNGVFDEVVANFYAPVFKIDCEFGPLVDGVTDGFAEFAFGQDGAPEGELIDGFLEPTVDQAAFGGSHGLAKGGAGLGFSQTFFDLIEVGELAQDPGNESRGLIGGFKNFRLTWEWQPMSWIQGLSLDQEG